MVYRIDDTTAVSTLPALPTDNISTPGFFTGGSTGGQAATRVRFWWLNMVQEELIAIAMAAGLTLDKSNNGQVLAAIQKLIANVFGGTTFMPVQQGGVASQTSDKINLGQDATYPGVLRVSIANVDQGNLLSGILGATINGLTEDLPGLAVWYRQSTGRPAVACRSATGGITIIDVANLPDVQTLQGNLSSEQATRADQVATLTANVGTCVSGIYGKSSSDYQILGLYQQDSTGRPIVVFNNGNTMVYNGIANYTDVTTLQTNLTSFQAQQADQNSTFASEIAARIQTMAASDGTNAPIVGIYYFLGDGTPWFTANGISATLVQSAPGQNFYKIENLSGDGSGNLAAQVNGTTYGYAPSSAKHSAGNYDTFVIGGVRFLSFTTTAYDTEIISFPVAFSDTPSSVVITSSESQDGDGNSVTANIFKGDINKYNFTPHLAKFAGSTNSAIPSTAPVTITVLAMGPA